jgi:hypothetical protein
MPIIQRLAGALDSLQDVGCFSVQMNGFGALL